MLIKYCTPCQFHDVKQKDQEEMSYCRRESCYAQYSKCIAQKALKEFLARESTFQAPLTFNLDP